MTFFQGSKTATSTSAEDSLFDIDDNEVYYSTWLYLSDMEAADTVIIRVYVDDPVDTADVPYIEETKSGVQSISAYFIPTIPSRDYKVTIQQTTTDAGGFKTFNWRRVET